MAAYIGTFLVGIVCVILGISNMRGNISSLHSYHRARVAEEDIKPFGRLVGLGTVICGVAVMAYGGFLAAAIHTEKEIFATLGTAVMIAGLAVGLIISFYAMKKYNKGIF